MAGVFVTFEGPEGGGKSTNLAFLKDLLEQQNIPVVVTREPGGTSLGEGIRALLLDKKFAGMSSDAELLLMFAARAEHIHQVILPALNDNKVVLCDRFTDATYAYQGGGRKIDVSKIAQLEQLVQADLKPDMVLLFDIDARLGLTRAKKRGEFDRFEQEDIEFFEAVRQSYQQIALHRPKIYRVIEAGNALEKVQQQVAKCCTEIVERFHAR